MGVTPDSPVAFLQWHAATEEHLAQSGLPFTILHPNYFMQNIFAFAPTIEKDGAFYATVKHGRAGMVDVRDIAAVAVGTLTGSGHEGKTYEITGPETLSFADAAARLSAALGKPVRYVDVPRPALISALLGAGMPDWLANNLADLYDWMSGDGAGIVTDVVEKVGRKQPISLDQFARDFRSAFETSAAAQQE